MTNCYLLHETLSGKGVLVDPGDYNSEILEYIKDNDIDVVYIVATHGHADHIRGIYSFGFPVLIHELDGDCLHDPTKNLSALGVEDVKATKAERFIKDGDLIEVGDVRIEVLHTPGHTPGGISLKVDDMLFSGDTLFYEGVGRTDFPGGDYGTLMKSIKEKLFVLPDSVRVFPGHGPETTIGHEKKINPFL